MIPNFPNWSANKDAGELDVPAFTLPLTGIPSPRAVAIGPDILNQATDTLNARYYLIYHTAGFVKLLRANDDGITWGAPITLGGLVNPPNNITVAFNAEGEAVVFYEYNNEIFHYAYSGTPVSTKVADGNGPVAEMDYAVNAVHPSANVMVAYVRDEQLYYKLDGDAYTAEHSIPIATAGATGVQITGIGFRVDRRLQVKFRYFAPESNLPTYDAYVLGSWIPDDTYGDPYWTTAQNAHKTEGIVWQNDEAQLSIISSVETSWWPTMGYKSVATDLDGFEWTTVTPVDADWFAEGWFGFGVAQTANRGDGSVPLDSFYEITMELTVEGVTRKWRLKEDPDESYGRPLHFYEILDDVGTLAATYTDFRPVGSGDFMEQSYGAIVYYFGSVENVRFNFWWEDIATLFPANTFGVWNGVPQIGTVDMKVTARCIAGTYPDLVGGMRFHNRADTETTRYFPAAGGWTFDNDDANGRFISTETAPATDARVQVTDNLQVAVIGGMSPRDRSAPVAGVTTGNLTKFIVGDGGASPLVYVGFGIGWFANRLATEAIYDRYQIDVTISSNGNTAAFRSGKDPDSDDLALFLAHGPQDHEATAYNMQVADATDSEMSFGQVVSSPGKPESATFIFYSDRLYTLMGSGWYLTDGRRLRGKPTVVVRVTDLTGETAPIEVVHSYDFAAS